MTDDILAGIPCEKTIEYLLKRRSTSLKHLSRTQGPSARDIETILSAAARVPDHNKVCPWYFIVFEGDKRAEAGEILASYYQKSHPQCHPDKLEKLRETFMRAPVVIAVISRIREANAPIWEQALSAGAACHSLSLAANALGFGTNWLTEWYSFDPHVKNAFDLDERDHFAGFIYIGKIEKYPDDRDRPDLSEIVNYWDGAAPINKGDKYGRKGRGYPEDGFDFNKIKRG